MYVYVVTAGRRHVKIGHSRNVYNRVAGIQTGCPFTVKIAGHWSTPHAREIERRAHAILAKYRWAGEWFDVPSLVACKVVSMLSATWGLGESIEKQIIFCRNCSHSAVSGFVSNLDAKFRCSKCNSRDHVHVIDFVSRPPKRFGAPTIAQATGEMAYPK